VSPASQYEGSIHAATVLLVRAYDEGHAYKPLEIGGEYDRKYYEREHLGLTLERVGFGDPYEETAEKSAKTDCCVEYQPYPPPAH